MFFSGWVETTEVGDGISPWMKKYASTAASISETESASGCMEVLRGAVIDDSGSFFNYDGSKLPW
jgi:hypothetical protein